MLEEVREQAHVIIDTSDLSGRQLRERLKRSLALEAEEGIALQLISFGFKYGVPLSRTSSSTCASWRTRSTSMSCARSRA